MSTQQTRDTPTACLRALAAIAAAAFSVAAASPLADAQQRAPQNMPTPPDTAQAQSAPLPPEAKALGDAKAGVLKPPDIDPKMTKAVPDIDPAMNNPPPGASSPPSGAPPAGAKPR